jgi:integrase
MNTELKRKDPGLFFKNGNWHIDFRTPNGRRRRKKIGTSKKFAKNVLCKIRGEMAEGKFLDVVKKERIKFEDFALQYLNDHSKQRKKSWITDSYHINDLIEFFKGKLLFEITALDIERFIKERLQKTIGETKKTITPSTVNRQLGTLRGMLNKAVVWGKLKSNPMKSVQFLKEPTGRTRFLETEEIVKVLSNCSEDLRPMVVMAVFAGMRRGEIFKLKWNNIDYRRGIITLLDTKNGAKRELPMNKEVKDAIVGVRKHPESLYVFCNKYGEPRNDIRKSFSTALSKSGITNFRFHDLRHSFASQLVMAGVDLNTVRELLGHKDITMTLRYSHLAPKHKQDAVDILSKKMDSFWTVEPNPESVKKSEVSEVIANHSVTF